jgi:hypothetical protein
MARRPHTEGGVEEPVGLRLGLAGGEPSREHPEVLGRARRAAAGLVEPLQGAQQRHDRAASDVTQRVDRRFAAVERPEPVPQPVPAGLPLRQPAWRLLLGARQVG